MRVISERKRRCIMAERRTPKEAPSGSKGDQGRDAKAEFRAYKNRIEQAATSGQASAAFHAGSPVGPLMGFGPRPGHSMGLPGRGAGMPSYPVAPGLQERDTTATLLGGLGTTLRLAVELLNAGLSGGTRVLQELASSGFGPHDSCGCHGCGNCFGGCCEPCCQPSCCQPSCCGCDSCTPSVGTCC